MADDFDWFVENVKGALRAGVESSRGGRDLTPMLHLKSPNGVQIVGVDPQFFTVRDQAAAQRDLAERFIVPLVEQNDVHMMAITWTAMRTTLRVSLSGAGEDRSRVVAAVVLSPDAQSGWIAPLTETDPRTVGAWEELPSAMPDSALFTRIKEALR